MKLGLPRRAICTYVGRGRDRRSVDLDFEDGNGRRRIFDKLERPPIYRAKVYADGGDARLKQKVEKLMLQAVV